MKICGLILFLSLFFVNIKGQNLKKEKKSIELFELCIIDSLFIKNLSIDILGDTFYNKKIDSSFYLVYIKNDKDFVRNNIVVTKLPFRCLNNSINQGFVRIKEEIFIIRGDKLDGVFVPTDNIVQFFYEIKLLELKGKFFDYDSLYPQEFPTWMFIYSNNKLSLLNKFWLPKE